jgi:hypothetical protein
MTWYTLERSMAHKKEYSYSRPGTAMSAQTRISSATLWGIDTTPSLLFTLHNLWTIRLR